MIPSQRLSKRLLALASAGALAASLAACGTGEGSGGEEGGSTLKLGTTDVITAVDPAGAYDIGSWNLQYSLFQQLVTIPAGASDVQPDAAESCEYTDPKRIECKLKAGLKFANGNDLTSSDVKFSFERNIAINDPNGASVLLYQISDGAETPKLKPTAIEAPDDTTVIFNLNAPDTTFLKLLSTAMASIVDEETFPADKLLADGDVVGSGPFELAQYKSGEQAVLQKNDEYQGDREAQSDRVFVTFFDDSAPLKTAIEQGDVDVAWRTMSPTELNDLKDKDGVNVIEGEGAEFRYWVWQFGTANGKNPAIRKAAAHIIDREAIAERAYDGTVTPAYSIVPPGFGGQKDAFKEAYPQPDVEAAKKVLADGGVKTPVNLTLGWNPDHYGPNTVDEATELKNQLEASGLFTVKMESAEWEEYQKLYKQNAYDLFVLGWYPDILDADNYLSPFVRDGGFFENNYSNKEVNALIDQELAETDEAKREDTIGQLQDKVATDVPLIPSWFGKNVAVARDGVDGVEETLDPTYIFRLWTISKS